MPIHKPRRYRDRRSLKSLLPGHDLPKPPVPPVPHIHVVKVSPFAYPGEPHSALWQFDQNISDPTSSLSGFEIDGHPGLAKLPIGPGSAICIRYAFPVVLGQTWTVTEGAGGITGPGGEPLAAGTGAVSQ